MIFSLKIEKYNTTNFYALSSQVNFLHTQRVRIRSCSGSYFPAFGLNSVFSPNAEEYGSEKLRIRTFFTQCKLIHFGPIFPFISMLSIFFSISYRILESIEINKNIRTKQVNTPTMTAFDYYPTILKRI